MKKLSTVARICFFGRPWASNALFQKETWTENSSTKALVALNNDSNLRVLWNNMLSKMHLTNMDNELVRNLLFLFETKFSKRRCVIYVAVDGFGPSPHQDNSAIRQLLKCT